MEMTPHQAMISGFQALEIARSQGLTLAKFTDPVEEARSDLSLEEALEIAREDPSLIYLPQSRRIHPHGNDEE